jgi:ketosteroid isomerase-like protein
MPLRPVVFVLAMSFVGSGASAEVVRVAEAEALATFKDGGATFSRFETSDVHPRVTGDLAVVTGRLQRTRRVSPSTTLRTGGPVAEEDWQFTKVYRRDASGWRVITYHAWELPK